MTLLEKGGKKSDLTVATWYGQIAFFVLCSLFFIHGWRNGLQRDAALFYLIASGLMVALGALNNALAPQGIRNFFILVIVMFGTFLVPFSLHAYGQPVQIAVAGSLLYVMVTFAISPRLVAIGALVAALSFSCYLHYKKNVFEKYPVFKEQLAKEEILLEGTGIPTLKSEIKLRYFNVPREMSLRSVSALKEVYGDADCWEYLYLANKAQIKNPKYPVLAGARLLVPELPALPYADFSKIALAYLAAAGLEKTDERRFFCFLGNGFFFWHLFPCFLQISRQLIP